MRIYLAADHAGFLLKERVKQWLKGRGYTWQDEGAFSLEAADDYPDFVHIVARHVAAAPDEDRGIVFGGSGQGEAMVANRYPGVRAAVFYGGSEQIVELSRVHNNANILSLGARFVTEEAALEAVKLWLETDFSRAERHVRRIKKIDNLISDEHQF
jgi:ribose 5-phosphate isomerase B